MWFEFFVLWGAWFWVLMLCTVGTLLWCMDREWGVGATGTLIISALMLTFFGNVNPFAWVAHHGLASVLGLLAYFVIGTGWSYTKWWIFARDRFEGFERAKADYLKGSPVPTVTLDTIKSSELPWDVTQALSNEDRSLNSPDAKAKALTLLYQLYNTNFMKSLKAEDLAEIGPDGKLTERPYIRNHRALVMTWLTYWPFSMLWAVMNDFVHRIFRIIYLRISAQLQAISDQIFRNSNSKLVDVPTAPTASVDSPK